MRKLLPLLLLAASLPARADEGMWTFDAVPDQKLQASYGFTPSKEWLERVRLSSVRLAGGCSGSFVSGQGLVMTNHHCVHDCIADLSTKQRDFVKDGFWAATQAQERACPGMEVGRLVEIRDVTGAIREATKGKSGEEFARAQRAAMARLEMECATSDRVRCDVITLYGGGKFDLYRYERFQDVRLVFAPELAAAFFGGDPDNFDFPRYALDVSFLRVHDGGKPLATPQHLGWSERGAQAGDLTFVSGHPWSTPRLFTPAELEVLRDLEMPVRLLWLSELRGLLGQYQRRSPEAERHATELLFAVENGIKARRGMLQALQHPELLAGKGRELEAIRRKLAGNRALLTELDQALATIRERQAELRRIHLPYTYLEGGSRMALGFAGDLFGHARTLVRAAEELPRPSEERMRGYGDASLPALRQRVAAARPVFPEMEIELLAFSLTKLREALGADHPAVRAALGKESPRQVATRAVRGTKLGDPARRTALLEGGAKALAAAKDPMIELARAVDPMARAVRARHENEVEAPMTRAREVLARARFAALGTSVYPDATGTLRLSFGQVKGWTEPDGTTVDPFTTYAGAYEHATGAPPYELPPSWTKARERIDRDTRLNFVTTNDIIGGNSGSPVFDREGRVVGLIFDGNLHSLGGDYGFDPALNRAIAVHSEGILEALRSIYGAKRLLAEIEGP